jgi:hypothetical protein
MATEIEDKDSVIEDAPAEEYEEINVEDEAVDANDSETDDDEPEPETGLTEETSSKGSRIMTNPLVLGVLATIAIGIPVYGFMSANMQSSSSNLVSTSQPVQQVAAAATDVWGVGEGGAEDEPSGPFGSEIVEAKSQAATLTASPTELTVSDETAGVQPSDTSLNVGGTDVVAGGEEVGLISADLDSAKKTIGRLESEITTLSLDIQERDDILSLLREENALYRAQLQTAKAATPPEPEKVVQIKYRTKTVTVTKYDWYVKAATENSAIVANSSGSTLFLKVGDSFKDGVVKKIDHKQMVVTTSKGIIGG